MPPPLSKQPKAGYSCIKHCSKVDTVIVWPAAREMRIIEEVSNRKFSAIASLHETYFKTNESVHACLSQNATAKDLMRC